MSLFLILALVGSASADFTELDAKKQRDTLQRAASAAEGELPPCEGHDRLHETAKKFAPPSSCPKAKEIFDFMVSASEDVRKNCRDTVGWFESRLRKPKYCSSAAETESTLKTATALKKNTMPRPEPARISSLLADNVLNRLLDDDKAPVPASGEWSRLECRAPALAALRLRYVQVQLADKHFGIAESSLTSVCNDAKAATEYLDFAAKGEDGR